MIARHSPLKRSASDRHGQGPPYQSIAWNVQGLRTNTYSLLVLFLFWCFVCGQFGLRLVEILLLFWRIFSEVLDLVLEVLLVERLRVHAHLLPHVAEELRHGRRLRLLRDHSDAGLDL